MPAVFGSQYAPGAVFGIQEQSAATVNGSAAGVGSVLWSGVGAASAVPLAVVPAEAHGLGEVLWSGYGTAGLVPAPPDSPTPGYTAVCEGRAWTASSLLRLVKAWPAKLAPELVMAEFDFAPDLAVGDAVASCTVAVGLVQGVDASPGAVLQGAPSIKGRRVFQRLGAGVGGCVYLVQCQVTTLQGSVLVLARLLPVDTLTIH